jgi:hypothetical protein
MAAGARWTAPRRFSCGEGIIGDGVHERELPFSFVATRFEPCDLRTGDKRGVVHSLTKPNRLEPPYTDPYEWWQGSAGNRRTYADLIAKGLPMWLAGQKPRRRFIAAPGKLSCGGRSKAVMDNRQMAS